MANQKGPGQIDSSPGLITSYLCLAGTRSTAGRFTDLDASARCWSRRSREASSTGAAAGFARSLGSSKVRLGEPPGGCLRAGTRARYNAAGPLLTEDVGSGQPFFSGEHGIWRGFAQAAEIACVGPKWWKVLLSLVRLRCPRHGESSMNPWFTVDLKPGGRERLGRQSITEALYQSNEFEVIRGESLL